MRQNQIILLVAIISLGLGACSTGRASEAEAQETRLPESLPVLTPPSPFVTSSQMPVDTPSPDAGLAPSPSPVIPAAPTQTPLACWKQGGHYVKGSLPSDLLPLPMEYKIYLPPCYDQQVDRRYPVLYLIHGQNYDNDQWDRLGVDEKADALIAAGDIPPLIIVLPRDRSWAQPTQDKFGEVLVEGLIPLIDASYRTLPDRAHRAIGGLSRGGGWAVNLGLSHWELFSSIGADSLAVFWTDTSQIRGWLDAIPFDDLPRIYLDIGQDDRPVIMESARWFEKVLTDKSIPHEWHLFPGRHDEPYWSSHVEGYLRWYTQGW